MHDDDCVICIKFIIEFYNENTSSLDDAILYNPIINVGNETECEQSMS